MNSRFPGVSALGCAMAGLRQEFGGGEAARFQRLRCKRLVSDRRACRTAVLPSALALLCAVSPVVQSREPVQEVRVGYTSGAFADANRSDAVASIKAWIEAIASQRGFDKQAIVRVFDSATLLGEAVTEEELHLAVMQSYEFLEIEPSTALDPLYLPARGEGVSERILLLVGAHAPVTDLEDLRGTRLMAHHTAGSRLGELWLDHELADRQLPEINEFFDTVEFENSPNKVILPVFFGQRQACVISEKAFEVAAELNPQLLRRLRPLLSSPAVASSVVCVWRGNWDHKQDLIAGLAELGGTTQGKQILTVFKIDRLIPFKREYLDNVRALVGTAPRSESGILY